MANRTPAEINRQIQATKCLSGKENFIPASDRPLGNTGYLALPRIVVHTF